MALIHIKQYGPEWHIVVEVQVDLFDFHRKPKNVSYDAFQTQIAYHPLSTPAPLAHLWSISHRKYIFVNFNLFNSVWKQLAAVWKCSPQ